MDVSKDFSEPDFSETELLRRVCAEYKFVMEGDVIYTEHMSTAELEHIHQGSKLAQNEPNLIPVLLVLRGQEVPLEDVPHFMASESTTTSRDNDAVMTRTTSRMEILRGESFIAGIKTAQLARSQHGGEIFSSGMKAALSLNRTSHNSFAQLPLTSDPPRYKTVNTREEGKTPHAEDLQHIDTVRTSIPLGIHPIVGFLAEAGLAVGGTSVDVDARVVIQELEVIHGSDGAADDVMVKISWHGKAQNVTLALESDNTWYERWQMVLEKLPQPPEAYSIPSNSFPPATAPTPPPLEKPLVTKSPVFSTALSLATDKQIHHFRFLVDGEWRIVDNLPTAVDSTGALANYLVVGHGHRRDSPSSAEVIPPVKVYHEPQWTSEIPLELSEAAAVEIKFRRLSRTGSKPDAIKKWSTRVFSGTQNPTSTTPSAASREVNPQLVFQTSAPIG
ncbi:galactose metabolism-related protein [Marasmius tenuissimus]|uniref:Galactose metabolism-related protein n=1 Tax=Marasmius tenuissimus TaxID=585030 RepID=A0ABR2ZAS7_9AGAR